MKRPVRTSEWQPLFLPHKAGNYVNDHAILQGPDGQWHLFGITSHEGDSENERYFVHAAGPSLTAPMEEMGVVIDNGARAWAPGVIEQGGLYYMFYGPSPTKLDISEELTHWMGYEVRLEGVPPLAVHRDHMVCRLPDGSFVMYAVGVKGGFGCVSALTSRDLMHWRFAGYALTSGGDAPLTPPWGAFESPYVVERDGLYYLFVTYTDCSRATYEDTLVACSHDPLRFGHYDGHNAEEVFAARLQGHASEILRDPKDGQWYMTTCGWRGYGIPVEGGVAIARLAWQ